MFRCNRSDSGKDKSGEGVLRGVAMETYQKGFRICTHSRFECPPRPTVGKKCENSALLRRDSSPGTEKGRKLVELRHLLV